MKRFTPAKTLALGHLMTIFVGAFLLMLPISSTNGQWTDFLSSLFTSTSATCVTGLVVVDTASHWSLFGQIVILCLIQVGGLGFVSMGVLFSMFLKRRIRLGTRTLLSESLNTDSIGGVIRLVRKALLGTLIIEGIGMLCLATVFIPQFGILQGFWFSLFHSVSAFCNAGFDILGEVYEPYASLVPYAGNVVINVVIMSLIVIGGIGFVVWSDLLEHRLQFRKYRLHTKIVLVMTTFLLVGGCLLFYYFEQDGVLKGLSVPEQLMYAMFSSVTARTAGFNTVDYASVRECSILLMIVLMYIGGSPGSTAGGIKTTTASALVLSLISNIRGEYGTNVFNRQISNENIRKSSNLLVLTLILAVGSIMAICGFQNLDMMDVAFEVFSALGTVGLTVGITRDLLPICKVILIVLMYLGRVGTMSFAYGFFEKKKVPALQNPVEKVMVG